MYCLPYLIFQRSSSKPRLQCTTTTISFPKLNSLLSYVLLFMCLQGSCICEGMHKAVLGQAADLPIHRAEEPESPSHTSVSLTGKEKSSRKHDRVDWTREEQPQKCSKLVSVEPRRV
jgi:hypothetical protein